MKKLIMIMLLSSCFSSIAYANDKKIEVNLDNSVSGAVMTLASILEDRIKKSSEEDQAKYEAFKEKLNAKLNRDFINQKIYFKTNNSKIDESIKNYITNMIVSLDNYKSLNYTLDGYSDARGDEKENLKLSKNRSVAVKEILLSLDIPINNIKNNNYGESKSNLHLDLEDYFFDRKVEIIIKK